jgi:hypothetical protein
LPIQKLGFWGIPVEKVREMNTPKGRLECGVSASHPTGIWQQLWDIVRFRR